MRIVKLMVCEFIEQIKNNFVTATLMSVVSVVLVVFVSIYSLQYNKYKPFKNLNFKNGFFVTCDYYQDVHPEQIEGVDKIYGIYKDELMSSENEVDYSINFYEKWVWESKPNVLALGEWFTQEMIDEYSNQGKVPVIVGGNSEEYTLGECFELYLESDYNKPESKKERISFCVVGIFSTDESVIGENGKYNISSRTYEAFYDSPDEMCIGNKAVLFAPAEALRTMNMDLFLAGKYFLKYDDSLSSQDIKNLDGKLYGLTSGTGIAMRDFRVWSQAKLKNTLLTYVPFVLIGLMIIMLSVYSLANISVSRQTKHMGIFTVVGASRKHNFLMLLSNAIGTIFIASLLSLIEIVYYKDYALKHEMYFEMSNICVIAIVVVYLFFFVFMTISMYLAFRKKTTRGMLISLHK